MTPFARAAVASDFASPLSHSGSGGLAYINSDVTLYLHRAPVGDWLGFEKRDHQATLGVAIGECRLYDVKGQIGLIACAALGQRAALAAPKR
jgi:acyl-CoA thioesterase